MTFEIIWTEPALDDWAKLDRQVARQIDRALTRLAETGEGDLSHLKRPLEGHRLRVRDWRVLLYLDRQAGTVTVRAIEHRSKAYKQR
ncbi:MAG: type II toxin-antitoxin system RelE family toxin [Anaerolineae bacterium]